MEEGFVIALFGGSFDPVHEGHCHLATELLKRFSFTKLFIVPAKQNPLRDRATATPEQRLHMLRLAVGELNEPRIEILDWEVKRPGPSYTIDTIQELAKKHTDISLVAGNELLATFPLWKNPAAIVKLAHIIIIERNPNTETTENFIDKVPGNKGWESVDIQALPYSSTMLRGKIKEKWESADLESSPQGIQRSVWLFIKENRLYCR